MTDESDNLVLRLLQEIRADLTEVKRDVRSIKETQGLHSLRLNTYSENFDTIIEKFHEIIALLRDRATAADLRTLATRVDVLENRRQ